ncbi:unnamed protein product, partial [marine sediment metagenome]
LLIWFLYILCIVFFIPALPYLILTVFTVLLEEEDEDEDENH